ncbi:MAG: DUF72 domain-containing protein [Candidatus Acidiferrales bacterium]
MAKPEGKSRLEETIRIGPAGWSYEDWNGIVYPSRRPAGFHEAAYLADFFDAIEINTSFYYPLRPDHASHWLERVAQNARFLFTAKLWQKFTHEPGATLADEQAVRDGFQPLQAAGKLGAVLLQFPYSFHRTTENVARLSALIERFSDLPLVVEVRHASWNDKDFYAMLEERGVGFCNIDQPLIGRSLRPSGRSTARVGYVRLHGRRYDTWFTDDAMIAPEERYNYLYREDELQPWAERIRKVAAHSKATFVITNNHFQGKAIVNALQLISILRGTKVKVPEPLRHRYPELESISSEPAQEPTLFPNPPR